MSAIIGKNGVGKSSILKYIKNSLPTGVNSHVSNDIIIMSENQNGQDRLLIYYPTNISIKEDRDLNIDNSIIHKLIPYERFRGTDHISFIYYSYTNEFFEKEFHHQGLDDISTTNMIRRLRSNILEENVERELKARKIFGVNDLDRLGTWDNNQFTKFRNFAVKEEIPLDFKLPDRTIISIIKDEDGYFFQESLKDKGFKYEVEMVKNLPNELSKKEDFFVAELLYSLYIDYLLQERKYTSNSLYNHKLSIKEHHNRNSYIIEFFSTMKNKTIDHEVNGELHEVGVRYIEKYLPVNEFINLIRNMMEMGFLEVVKEDIAIGIYSNESEQYFQKFDLLRDQFAGFTNFLNVRWRGLSAGEQSYITLMSRLYYTITNPMNKVLNNCCIMIDEGDIGYHPEWQRKFLKNILNLINWILPNKNIQLILTSNVPFITSDIPKSKILYLEKDENGKSYSKSKKENKESFASNIHDLFSDTFYLKGMLIGDYSKDIINKVIKYIEDSDGQIPDPNNKKIIQNIGEPILKNKLLQMWMNKFGDQEEIEILKKRIEELEKSKKK